MKRPFVKISEVGNSFILEVHGGSEVPSFQVFSYSDTFDELYPPKGKAFAAMLEALVEELHPYDKWCATEENVSISLVRGHKYRDYDQEEVPGQGPPVHGEDGIPPSDQDPPQEAQAGAEGQGDREG